MINGCSSQSLFPRNPTLFLANMPALLVKITFLETHVTKILYKSDKEDRANTRCNLNWRGILSGHILHLKFGYFMGWGTGMGMRNYLINTLKFYLTQRQTGQNFVVPVIHS